MGQILETVDQKVLKIPWLRENLMCQISSTFDLNKMHVDCPPSHEGNIAADKAVDQIGLAANNSSVEYHNNSGINRPVHEDKQNGPNPGRCVSEISRKPMVEGDPGSTKQSNGFSQSESDLSENGFCSLDEVDRPKFSVSGKACNLVNDSETEITVSSADAKAEDCQHREDLNTAPQTEPEVTCLYHCCSDCLRTLLSLMQKVLLQEWKSDGSHLAIDDVHDKVASPSVDLVSTVRRVYAAGCGSNKFDENLRNENHGKFSSHQTWSTCCCKSSEYSLVIPMECSCHSVGTSSPNIHLGFDPKFVYRDGVMVPTDPNQEVSFHCKFETLCLCSLIESMLMTKQSFD